VIVRRALQGIRSLGHDLLAFAYPQRCPSCGGPAAHTRLLCDECLALIPRLGTPLCAWCLARGRAPAGCIRHPSHRVWAAWVYDERAALVVHALKYGGRPRLADELGVELARTPPREPRPDLVLEVPLHPARRRERGYNQAGLLADALSLACGTPRLEGTLSRVRPTRPQARLDPGQRRENVSGAFRVRRPDCLRGRNVLIVDDVMTTGSTLEACLEVLSEVGARPTGVALAWAQ